jgi:hypothetical protein
MVRQIGCAIGSSVTKRELSNLHAHHPIPKNMGGADVQKYIYLPDDMHRTFHYVLHVLLLNDKSAAGLHNWSSKAAWKESKMTRKSRYNIIMRAAKAVDTFCKTKPGARISDFVRINKKNWGY